MQMQIKIQPEEIETLLKLLMIPHWPEQLLIKFQLNWSKIIVLTDKWMSCVHEMVKMILNSICNKYRICTDGAMPPGTPTHWHTPTTPVPHPVFRYSVYPFFHFRFLVFLLFPFFRFSVFPYLKIHFQAVWNNFDLGFFLLFFPYCLLWHKDI